MLKNSQSVYQILHASDVQLIHGYTARTGKIKALRRNRLRKLLLMDATDNMIVSTTSSTSVSLSSFAV